MQGSIVLGRFAGRLLRHNMPPENGKPRASRQGVGRASLRRSAKPSMSFDAPLQTSSAAALRNIHSLMLGPLSCFHFGVTRNVAPAALPLRPRSEPLAAGALSIPGLLLLGRPPLAGSFVILIFLHHANAARSARPNAHRNPRCQASYALTECILRAAVDRLRR
jgi:hypothetical protein